MFETGTFLEGAIAASIATFGLPDINCDGEDMRPWLVVCPLIGFITMLNEWSKDPDGAPAAPEEGKLGPMGDWASLPFLVQYVGPRLQDKKPSHFSHAKNIQNGFNFLGKRTQCGAICKVWDS